MISIVIPVKNGGDDLRRCLDGIAAQRVPDEVEVVVVDSGSTDGSDALAEAAGARVHRIPPEEFNHGGTRNLGASLARGDVLVFTSQDAHAESEDSLSLLVAPLADPSVGGVYGRQIAHQGAKPPEEFFLDFLYGPRARVQRASSAGELSMETTLFSNVFSAMRRDVFERFRFVDDIVMSEDQEWSARVLVAGYAIVYEPRAVVRHSHDYDLRAAFRRFYESGLSARRAYAPGGGSLLVVARTGLDYLRAEGRWLRERRKLRWLPYALLYEGAKGAGLVTGVVHDRVRPS
ncbi:MAG: glycosyltransferase [Actinomycetota bacterium]|nr:glycosyltransferase [Actinomycetota bacterium]